MHQQHSPTRSRSRTHQANQSAKCKGLRTELFGGRRGGAFIFWSSGVTSKSRPIAPSPPPASASLCCCFLDQAFARFCCRGVGAGSGSGPSYCSQLTMVRAKLMPPPGPTRQGDPCRNARTPSRPPRKATIRPHCSRVQPTSLLGRSSSDIAHKRVVSHPSFSLFFSSLSERKRKSLLFC